MPTENVVLHVADVHKSFGGLHALSDRHFPRRTWMRLGRYARSEGRAGAEVADRHEYGGDFGAHQ